MRHRHTGFSLIELMVAVTLAMITGLVVLQVLANYQTRKLTTAGRNDAQVNAALGLYTIEREVRMAGAGLTAPSGMLCNVGVNMAYNGVIQMNGVALQPLRLVDGGALPDRLEILRSNSNFGPAPTTILQSMLSNTSTLTVDGSAGFARGDVMLVGSADGTKLCTVMQLSADPVVNGAGWDLPHASGAHPYNPADPSAVFTTPIRYDVRDIVVNLGTQGVRSFAVVCSDGAAPSASNRCDLGWYDRYATANNPTLAQVDSIVPQVIEMQAQYGVAPAGSQSVDTWVDATGGTWGAPTFANARRIKAVRIALITRGSREPTQVSPATLTLWPGTTRALTAAERYYRYQVLSTVVPLINVIWAGV